MKITIEPFLFDNTLMNCCVYLLTAAWMGVRVRMLPVLGVSFLGALYALIALFYVPLLREPLLKALFFLLLSAPLFRRAGWFRTIPYLLLSAALTGGTAMLLTLYFGGSVYADGTMIGTVPVRAAMLSTVAACSLPRLIRRLLLIRRRNSLYTRITVQLETHVYRLDALIDSGNLLREPVSGLPVLLIERDVDRPTYPIPFDKLSGSGVLFGERPVSVLLTEYGNTAVDCVCAKAPEQIGRAQAILPESLLPYDWRVQNDQMDYTHLGSPAFVASRWQTRYLMVRSRKRGTPAAARSGGGSALHHACGDGQGGKG